MGFSMDKNKMRIPGIISLFLFLLPACGISGEIIYNKDAPHSHQEEFVFTPDSHAVVTLTQRSGADASSTTVKEIILTNIDKFPVKFKFSLDELLDFSKYTYSVSAKVFSQKGDKAQVGDLVTETVNELKQGQSFITVVVTGLESCSFEGSGGFCL